MELKEIQELATSLEKELKTAREQLAKQQTELGEGHRIAMDAMTKAQKMSEDTQKNVDKALAATTESGNQVRELAQKMDDLTKTIKEGGAGNDVSKMTMRQRLTKGMEAVQGHKEQLVKMSKGQGSMRIKAVANVDRTATAGLTLTPFIDNEVNLTRMPLTIRNLLTVIPVDTDAIKYAVQTTRTNNAKTVAEGAAKPYSTYAWGSATASVEVIAHLAKLTLQAIADAPRLVALIESEMRFGLALEEERQLLKGNGASVNELDGLWRNATEYAAPAGVDASLILNEVDRMRIALLQLQVQYASPTGIVLNPVDIANMELIRRDTGTTSANTGGYIFGNPDQPRPFPTLWGAPLVSSPGMSVGDFLTGAFDIAAHLYQREGVEVLISTENTDDFEKNLATMRCEERLGLAVQRGWALVKGRLGAGS